MGVSSLKTGSVSTHGILSLSIIECKSMPLLVGPNFCSANSFVEVLAPSPRVGGGSIVRHNSRNSVVAKASAEYHDLVLGTGVANAPVCPWEVAPELRWCMESNLLSSSAVVVKAMVGDTLKILGL